LGFGTDYVAPLLGEYSARYPHLEVELTLSDDPSWSSFHQWDVVIYIGELRDSSMHCTPLATNRRYVRFSRLSGTKRHTRFTLRSETA
jgi:DNA-binding transcriptional LysR family regulator